MALWNFNKESTHPAAGANNDAGRRAGFQPSVDGDVTNMVGKRNVILTDAGWVFRVNKTDVHGNIRKQEQTIVAANPGSVNNGYNANNFTFKPDIAQVYVKLNANGYISANVAANLYVVYNTPIAHKASGNLISLTIANVTSGNHGVALFSNNATARITGANNTLVFKMPKLRAGAAGSGKNTAVYQINAQSLVCVGGGHSLYNPDKGTTRSANLVLTGAVSNTISDGLGRALTSKRFTVRING